MMLYTGIVPAFHIKKINWNVSSSATKHWLLNIGHILLCTYNGDQYSSSQKPETKPALFAQAILSLNFVDGVWDMLGLSSIIYR